MAFLDEEDEALPLPESPGRSRRGSGGGRPSRAPKPPRPPTQALLIRRLIAVAVGLLFVFLIVLGFKGCLNARKDRAISTFVTDSSRIMTESAQNGQQFFALLTAPQARTPLEYEAEVKSLRGSSETLYERGNNLSVPDELGAAKSSLLISLELRRNALGVIADNIGSALGKENAVEAQQVISDQMKLLIGSDAVFQGATVPEISSVVDDADTTDALQKIQPFVPDPPAKWLDPATITAAFSAINPQSTEATPGLHGIGITSAKIGDTDLSPDTPVTVSAANPTLVVTLENGGESEETNVQLTATVGGTPVEKTVPAIGAGEQMDVSIQITPVPASGEQATVEVSVEPVPGEDNADNNTASYTVTFQ